MALCASVIIPVFNGAATLPDQLKALSAQTHSGEWEVIIADNGSTDGSAGVADRFFSGIPRLRVVDASAHRGTSYARNQGATVAEGEFLLFCDADDVASPRWLEAMLEVTRSYDLVGGPFEFATLNTAETRRVSWYSDLPQLELPLAMRFLHYAPSGNFGIRNSVLRDLGGWSSRYGYGSGCDGAEDVELCWRAQLADYRLGFAPEAVMHYRMKRRLWTMVQQRLSCGRADARLYRDFRNQGVPPAEAKEALQYWKDLWYTSSELRDPIARREWMTEAAYRWGRVWGSLRERVFYP